MALRKNPTRNNPERNKPERNNPERNNPVSYKLRGSCPFPDLSSWRQHISGSKFTKLTQFFPSCKKNC